MYHLKDGFEWKHSKTIPTTEIELVIFFSRCLTKVEFRYGSLELEMVCFVWVCKRLCTLLYSNNKCVVVLIDHKAICSIVNATSFNTLSTDCANRLLTNVSVYLSTYFLNIYYMFRRLNLVSDTFSYLQALGDDAIQMDKIIEPVLDIV
jgi:hypothetical protein